MQFRGWNASAQVVFFSFALTFLLLAMRLNGQVTTATLYGVIRDVTGAVAPAANVTVTNQGTNLSRTTASDARGEFALPALPAGQYMIHIELAGFKTYTNEGLQLGAGGTVRQTFEIEVGQVSENVTVEGAAPLVETASAAQKESLGTQQVTELPLSRRNLINLVTLAPDAADASVGIAGNGNIRLNGVAEGGSTITVDGTDAVANPETRGVGQYGGQSQISIMSVEAVAEVQVANRETAGVIVNGAVPTQQLKDQILAALPYPETQIALSPLPLPN